MELEDLCRVMTDQNNGNAEMLMDLLERLKPPKSIHPGSSEETAELDAAFVKMQGELNNASKGSTNPFHHSKYADLASCWDACREALAKNDIGVRQFTIPHHDRYHINIVTKLVHKSGQWESGLWEQRCQDRKKDVGWVDSDDPQTQGTAFTYGRRYALCGMLGIAPADSDGEPEGANRNAGKKYDDNPIKPAASKPDSGKSMEKEKSGASGSKTETKPPAPSQGSTASNSSGLSEANQKKLEDSMDKNEFTDSERADLLAVYDAETLADIPKDKFIKATRTISEIIKMRP